MLKDPWSVSGDFNSRIALHCGVRSNFQERFLFNNQQLFCAAILVVSHTIFFTETVVQHEVEIRVNWHLLWHGGELVTGKNPLFLQPNTFPTKSFDFHSNFDGWKCLLSCSGLHEGGDSFFYQIDTLNPHKKEIRNFHCGCAVCHYSAILFMNQSILKSIHWLYEQVETNLFFVQLDLLHFQSVERCNFSPRGLCNSNLNFLW